MTLREIKENKVIILYKINTYDYLMYFRVITFLYTQNNNIYSSLLLKECNNLIIEP